MKSASTALNTYLTALALGSIGGEIQLTTLYSFQLTNGATFTCTEWDYDIVYNGVTYPAFASQGGPFIKRGTISSAIGTDVQECSIELYATPANTLIPPGGVAVPVLRAIARKWFQNAIVTVTGLYLQCPGDGGYNMFYGLVGDITDVGRASCKIKIESMTVLLNQQMPRDVFSPGCRWTFGDVNCGFDKTTVTTTGTVTSGSNARVLNTSLTPAGVINPPASAPTLAQNSGNTNLAARTYYVVLTYFNSLTGETTGSPEATISVSANSLVTVTSPSAPSGASGTTTYNVYASTAPGQELLQTPISLAIGTNWTESGTGIIAQGQPPVPAASLLGFYSKGVISMLTGPNSGESMSIQGNTGGVITLTVPLTNPPTTGDTFSIVPGCVKTFGGCISWQGLTQARLAYGGEPNIPQPTAGI